jgi:hypothetical protein
MLGCGDRRYPLSRDFMGSIPKSPVDPILIVGSRKAVKPPEVQDHRNTTFAGQQKTVEEASVEDAFWVESTPRKGKGISRRDAKLAEEKEIEA